MFGITKYYMNDMEKVNYNTTLITKKKYLSKNNFFFFKKKDLTRFQKSLTFFDNITVYSLSMLLFIFMILTLYINKL